MNEFLKWTKDALCARKEKVTIVAGNEACDLDSMTSAILYAWFRSYKPPQNAFSKTYVPLLNIPRNDISLRPEFKALFKYCNINADNLTTKSDFPPQGKLPVNQTQWILVDHNKLLGDLGSIYSGRVSGCIDHRDDEDAVPKDMDPEPRVIEKCGSCSSLVLRELAIELSDRTSNSKDAPPYTSEALKLGLASILIDTNNLRNQDKVTKTDQEIATYLDEILRSRDSSWNSNKFFEEISEAERNLDGMPLKDILRKDYKQWTEGNIKLGTSSVVRDLDFLAKSSGKESTRQVDADHWRDNSLSFMAERDLDLWAVMTAYFQTTKEGKDEFKRQLVVFWRDSSSEKMVRRFEEVYGSELKLEVIDIQDVMPSDKGKWKTWRQGNIAASRKQVAPMLRSVMKQAANI